MRSWPVVIVVGALLGPFAGTAWATDRRPPRPVAVSAVGDGIVVRFDEQLVGPPRPQSLVIVVNGRRSPAGAVTVSGRSLRVGLGPPAYGDDDVRIAYDARAGSGLRDRAGNRVGSFAVAAVNRGPAGCTFAPRPDPGALAASGRIATAVVAIDFPDSDPTTAFATPVPGAPISVIAPPEDQRYVPPIVSHAGLPTVVAALSYGKLAADVQTIGWLRASKATTEYALGADTTWHDLAPFLREMLGIAAARADLSGSSVALLSLRHRDAGRLIGRLFSAPAGQGIVVDGTEIRHVAFTAAEQTSVQAVLRAVGVLDPAEEDVAAWDAWSRFAGTGELLGWHRARLGWLDPTQVRCVTSGAREVVLSPVSRSGGAKLAIAPLSPTSAIVAEVRRREGLDAGRCGEGLVVYRVDLTSTAPRGTIRLIRPRPPVPYDGRCFPDDRQTLDATADAPRSVDVDGVRLEVVAATGDGSLVVRVTRD